MPPAAPRIDERLIAALARLDDVKQPMAETHRRLGRLAAQLGLPRPSYEQVRVILHLLRAGRRSPTAGKILLDVTFRSRPPEALLDLLDGR